MHQAGVLPACYENAIEVEVQEQSEVSCFLRNEDGTVTAHGQHPVKDKNERENPFMLVRMPAGSAPTDAQDQSPIKR